MFFYYFPQCKIYFILLLLSLIYCHTVGDELEHISLLSQVETSTLKSSISAFKREIKGPKTVVVMDQTPFSTISEDSLTSNVSLSNRTLPLLKPSNMSSGFNITQSLPKWMATIKTGALERTGFVILGFMLIIVGFLVVRGIRLRKKKSKSRKYGIIKSTDIEMAPLDNDDEEEEEDTTLFDAQQKYSSH